MADEIANNKHLINAPAGSGKTTNIRTRLKSICLKEPKSKILCITYTNRAADELKKDLDSANVTVSTIHSYINDLISPFYPLKEALDLYWEIFKEKIEARIKNEERDEHIEQSNQHYIEKHGDLNVDLVRENLRELSYGETPFTSLYSGKLSHDDLIMFANKLIKKYPVLLRKISDKYNYIFIDEYQDTSAYILDIFYDAVVNKENIQLYLLGDRMQQIYRNYDGSFEEKLREFDTSQRLVVNHRSIGKIISWIFYPMLGINSWEVTVSTIQGLIAKEQVISSMSVIMGFSEKTGLNEYFTPLSAYAFMVFNLFSAPCFGAIGAMRKELGSAKKTIRVVCFQIIFAWCFATLINQLGINLILIAGMILGFIKIFRITKSSNQKTKKECRGCPYCKDCEQRELAQIKD